MKFITIFALACTLLLMLGMFDQAVGQCPGGVCPAQVQTHARFVLPRQVIKVPVTVGVTESAPVACAPPAACSPPAACEPVARYRFPRLHGRFPNRPHLFPRRR